MTDATPREDPEPTPSAAPSAAPPPDGGDAPAGRSELDGRLTAALAPLDTLSGRAVAEHPDVYEAVHAELLGELSRVDGAAPPAAPGR